ncbi:hypothetical protein WCLP8_4610006 [uncultured Gammaproteobacteria bacterium]
MVGELARAGVVCNVTADEVNQQLRALDELTG